MSSDSLASATRFLVLAMSALYILGAFAGLFIFDFDRTADVVLWLALILGGAALMLFGQLALPRGRRSAAMVSIGSVIGGLPLFWTLVVPVAVAAVVACSIALARRSATA